VFAGCSGLRTVSIPASVRSIGHGAFSSCYILKAINVQSENLWYQDIDGVLFSKNGKTLYSYPTGGGAVYAIPSGVTSIGNDAFYYNDRLTSVSIPSSVTVIGDRAFYGCYWLTSIELSRRTRIGEDAFEDVPGSLRYRD
jgi:hypothetical protein